jgi:GntR family transcriptional regulator
MSMGFTLTKRDIDRVGTVALYRQVADRLQTAIESGELQQGDPIPPEDDLADGLGVSKPVVREAIAELVRAGLLVKQRGALTRVASPPRMRHLDTSRYQHELDLLDQGDEHPKTSAFVSELGVDWSAYAIEADYTRGKATAADAQYLQIAEGEPIIRRQLLKFVNGEPHQLQRSTVPRAIAKGTVLEDEDAQPYPGGTIAELFAAGHRVTRVVEEAWARMPTGDERRALQLLQAGPVWDIVRVMLAKTGPVEASRVITPTATNKLRFVTDLK